MLCFNVISAGYYTTSFQKGKKKSQSQLSASEPALDD
jgi:hypothetical protein